MVLREEVGVVNALHTIMIVKVAVEVVAITEWVEKFITPQCGTNHQKTVLFPVNNTFL